MKNILIIFLVLSTAVLTQAKAQVMPGIKLGINNSTISKTLLDNKAGLYIGLVLDVPITDHYTIQPEVFYSNQGGTSNSTEFGDVEIDYLSIAAANKFYVGANKGFHFVLGPGLDINIQNNFVNFFNGEGDSEISPFDVVLFGGFGYEFPFGLVLEARYKQGTISIDFLGSDDLYEEDGSNLNGVFQLGAVYKFKI